MPAAIHHMPLRSAAEAEESFDVNELAGDAADALETYRRAAWRQLSDRVRLAKLRRAIELLQRVEGLETGRIPMRMWGD